jgi:hypothetical protein
VFPDPDGVGLYAGAAETSSPHGDHQLPRQSGSSAPILLACGDQRRAAIRGFAVTADPAEGEA